ncbi:aspartyl-phosphate phosphatase Spo0E family protein [Paenibacillus wynnii]|uniref:Spo0E family sporulation regulatory protein-aspartic acid phosphatase n=1 Tax=Paenibacillus wynnii TaxID=268407 RepID=UPI000A05E911
MCVISPLHQSNNRSKFATNLETRCGSGQPLQTGWYWISAYKRLSDPEVIKASQLLDDMLNTYNNLIQQKTDK